MTTYTYLSGPSPLLLRYIWGEVRPSNPLLASSSRVLSRRRPTTKSANGRMMRLPLPPLPPPPPVKAPFPPPLQSNNPEMVSEGWTTQCNLGRREEEAEGLSASALSRIYQCQDGREGIAYHFQGDHLGGGGDGKTIGTWDILRGV